MTFPLRGVGGELAGGAQRSPAPGRPPHPGGERGSRLICGTVSRPAVGCRMAAGRPRREEEQQPPPGPSAGDGPHSPGSRPYFSRRLRTCRISALGLSFSSLRGVTCGSRLWGQRHGFCPVLLSKLIHFHMFISIKVIHMHHLKLR